jgi:glycyl-tRNA synthetase beta subunit
MTIQDYESREFNSYEDSDFMKAALEIEKAIEDNIEVKSLRGAVHQIDRLKFAIDKLHKDYVKMMNQNKSIVTERE